MTIKEAVKALIDMANALSLNPNTPQGIALKMAIKALEEQESALDNIRAEILKCLNALDDIEKSGFNIYLPNEMSGRRLTYKQCLEFIDKYKADSEEQV